jgi:hypothetical protein
VTFAGLMTITDILLAGIDKDESVDNLSEFEIEIRRRLWVLLYVWDWYVGELSLSLAYFLRLTYLGKCPPG